VAPFTARRWAAIGIALCSTVATITAQPTTTRFSLYQSILAEGWKVTPAEAVQFESELARDPENLSLRTRLLSYYYQYMISEPRLRHVVWLIENHPDADVFLAAGDITAMSRNWTGLNEAADYQRVKALWLRQTERFSTNPKVLANAAMALTEADSEVSLELVKRARGIEPGNPEWTNWLAGIYKLAARSSFAGGYGNIRVFAGAPQDRNTLPSFSLPLAASDALKRELATSTDAALVGGTGEALVRESRLLMRGPAISPEVEQSAAFGEHLLARARALEPDNPRWR
jgi:hypothetical protein